MAIGLRAQTWTDRGEYDLALEARRKTAPQERLAALEQWKTKYPGSALKQQRAELFIAGYHSLRPDRQDHGCGAGVGQGQSRQLRGFVLDHRTGAYFHRAHCANAERVRVGRQAGSFGHGRFFHFAGVKQAGMTAEAAVIEKKRVQAIAHRTLGWVEWKRGNTAAAQKELLASLAIDPQNAETSAWIGTMLVPDPSPEKRTVAIWNLARAAYLDGDGALTGAKRREVRGLLEAAYSGYHGSLDGLDQVGAAGRRSVTPPEGFKVESAFEVAARMRDEEILRAHPELQEWMKTWKRPGCRKPGRRSATS